MEMTVEELMAELDDICPGCEYNDDDGPCIFVPKSLDAWSLILVGATIASNTDNMLAVDADGIIKVYVDGIDEDEEESGETADEYETRMKNRQ